MTVDRLIEDVAMAIGTTAGWETRALAAIEAIGIPLETLAALRAGTMKAVPVEPTEEMRRSGNNVQVGNWYRHIECSEHGTEYVPHCDECNNAPVINTLLGDSSAEVFKAMLAAAPANPENENDR